MNSQHNMLSAEYTFIANKGFSILDATFREKGWSLIKNELNWICYNKVGDETSYFDIKILPDKIVVSIPIKNSPYQYITSFKSYYEASEYIEQRFLDYIQN